MTERDADPWSSRAAYDPVLDGVSRGLDGLFPPIHNRPHPDNAVTDAEPPEPPDDEDRGDT